MSQYGSAVEYALHCLLYLARSGQGVARSTRDIAEFQKLSTDYVAKLFTRLEKAGVVTATEGIRGGFHLARAAVDISVLDVVDAVEGRKPLFECREVRANCVLFDGAAPAWSGRGVCGIHAVMLTADAAMRNSLAQSNLAALAAHVTEVVPKTHQKATQDWFEQRARGRGKSKKRSAKNA
ncbi:MAG: Rrf2 family transcriptional regulator [Rhodospirillaceae bacterium]|jgi:Rrf2 family protein|nr:Rrf2 family transcriptional regulator [Rhodospirillaceae bacterium]MBT3492808.1 Rrf2 family transcriptional regulator [Rhodospirillaceae bacterium]MBT3779497.1 Rrf2 family transcriptional regulator [Rhodospirillaceae bacterium]MBT3977940.1 Rrf2 family transcriptional regulator [Rhodospirillaceae bacterium]MBT4166696.1 Rrf2 family transcriptional regulator [Rhodospirillaceae bacterium]